MSGQIASPVFVNGADDDLLVGDTVDVVVTEQASVSTKTDDTASKDTFIKENGTPTQDTSIMSEEAKQASGVQSEAEAAAEAKVLGLDPKDQEAAVELVKELVESGDIKTLAENEEVIDDLLTATGMEDRLKELSSDFDLDDFSPDVKLDMLENMDWDASMDVGSMTGLFTNMEAMWPSIEFDEFQDALGIEALKDATFMDSLLGDADWLDNGIMGEMLDLAGDALGGLSDTFLRKVLSDFASDKQVEMALEIIGRLDPHILRAINNRLVEQLLKVYPMGFHESYRGTLRDAYNKLTDALRRIDPEWYVTKRNDELINDLGPYYEASPEALHVFSYDDPHAINACLADFHNKIGYENLMVNGVLLPPVIEPVGT